MATRKALELRSVMVVYNLMMVGISLYLFLEVSHHGYMAPLHVVTLNMRLYYASRVSNLYLCTKNEIMAPLHVATSTVKRELP